MHPKDFVRLYRDHLSDFPTWKEKDHAAKWLIFPQNIGADLSIDEVTVTSGELYTILTNKAYHGRKGCLVAIVEGTKSNIVSEVVCKIPEELRKRVKTVTRDLSESMQLIVTTCFPKAIQIDDRFHVQKLVTDALQEIRIEQRKEAIKEHNKKVKEARERKGNYWAPRFENGDTRKELLARSRHLLYKPSGKWSKSQKERAKILFREYPQLKDAYILTMRFRGIYEHAKSVDDGLMRMQLWYRSVELSLEKYPSFETPLQTIRLNEDTIANYFDRRLTNASAESFNAKVKNFRALQRGVSDITFFMYRLSKLYG